MDNNELGRTADADGLSQQAAEPEVSAVPASIPCEDRVVFLDIDGPMIPTTMYLVDRMCSFHRLFPPTTVAVMNKLCEESGAKVVFNTTHNNPMRNVADIEVALVEQGLDIEHIHATDPKTRYPSLPRDLAVREWLARHPEVVHWIAFDDVRFTNELNLIVVDPDAGLHMGHLNQALGMLGCKQCVILI